MWSTEFYLGSCTSVVVACKRNMQSPCALLVFLFGAASAESNTSLYFYQHIAKTGGTSWSLDLAKLGPWRHCGTSLTLTLGTLL